MRDREEDTSQADARMPRLYAIQGGAGCAACGNATGIHPRWWYDGDDELVPYCEECSPYVGADSSASRQ